VIRQNVEEDGALLRITLASPKANILDMATLEQLTEAMAATADPLLRGVLIDHDGPNFSFGAAVEEHLPDRASDMLHWFSRCIRAVVHSPVPVLVAVDGRCLGGGMELAIAGHVLIANEAAQLGQPEIVLGVYPPAAIALIPWRAPILRRLVLTGESMDARTLASAGLVTLTTDGSAADAALAFFRQHFAPRSAFALRQVTGVCDPGNDFDQALYQAEQHYLQVLMHGLDPVEGLHAFIQRRAASWEHR